MKNLPTTPTPPMKNKNSRFLLTVASFIICLLSSSPVGAQTFEGTVIDENTRQPLPFASIYANKKSSTITNAVGTFSIRCDSADVLRISYVGYKTRYVKADTLQRLRTGVRVGCLTPIVLTPLENQLEEVTVTAVDLKHLIRKATKEMRRQLRKFEKRESSFFYRQITFADSTCFELMEAFLQARSAVYLRSLFLLKGRFAGIKPDSLHRYAFWTNYFTVSSLPMLTRYDYQGNTDIKPLTRNYKDFYDIDYDVLADGRDRIVAVHFIPKSHITQPVLAVTLYVDEQTFRLRKMEGKYHHVRILQKDFYYEKTDTVRVLRKKVTSETSTFKLTVNMTEERGFSEVQSVYIDQEYERYGKHMSTRSILFNIGNQEADEDKRQLWKYSDLHTFIQNQGYDPEFWNDNEIVRRTPVEEQVMRLFEQENLFGVM